MEKVKKSCTNTATTKKATKTKKTTSKAKTKKTTSKSRVDFEWLMDQPYWEDVMDEVDDEVYNYYQQHKNDANFDEFDFDDYEDKITAKVLKQYKK